MKVSRSATASVIVDRLTFRATIIETGTESYRLKHARSTIPQTQQVEAAEVETPSTRRSTPGGSKSE